MFSLVAQLVKTLLAMQETCVQSLDQEDALEKEMATHSSDFPLENFIAYSRLWSMGSQRVGHDWVTMSSPIPLTPRSFWSHC